MLILIITSTLIFILPFMNIFKVNYVDGHDFLLHYHMIYTLEEYVKKGIILPRWLPNANYGYGSPIMTYMWGVPYYIGVLLHILGFSYSQVFKFLLLTPNLLSGLGMYLWINRKFGRLSAIVAAIIYLWSPYRFVDTFIRGAIGELFFFAFLPFIFFFIDSGLSYKYLMLGMITTALMIYSHQGLSMIGFIILLTYIVINYFLKKERAVLFKRLYILFGGLLLTAFYWIPAISYIFLLPFGHTVNLKWFPPLLSLIRSPWQGGMVSGRYLIFSYQIGLTQLGVILFAHFSILYSFLKKNKSKIWLIYWVLLFWISILLMQPISYYIWTHIPLIAYLQFPFRLLFIPMFVSAILGAFIIDLTGKNTEIIFGLMITLFVIIANRNHLGVLSKQINMQEFQSYAGTYDVSGEKIPKYANTKQIFEEYKNGLNINEVSIIDGQGTVLNQNRKNYQSEAQIFLQTEGTVFIKRTFFPGWEIYLNNQKIREDQIIKGNGILLNLKSGSYSIKAQYTDPLLVKISTAISVIFFLFLIYKLTVNYLRKSKVFKQNK